MEEQTQPAPTTTEPAPLTTQEARAILEAEVLQAVQEQQPQAPVGEAPPGLQPAAAPPAPEAPEWMRAYETQAAATQRLEQAIQQMREAMQAQAQRPAPRDPLQDRAAAAAAMRQAGLDPSQGRDVQLYMATTGLDNMANTFDQIVTGLRQEIQDLKALQQKATHQASVGPVLDRALNGRALPDVSRNAVIQAALGAMAQGQDPGQAVEAALAPFMPLLAAQTGLPAGVSPAAIRGGPQASAQRAAAAAATAVPGGVHGRGKSVDSLSVDDLGGLIALSMLSNGGRRA